MLSRCPTYLPHTPFVIFSSTYYMLKERFFFIGKDCTLDDDTLVEALYVHVGVWYVLGPNFSHLPPGLARPPVCHYFSPYLWQVGPIFLGCGMPHLSWSSLMYWRDLTFHGLYSPHITHTQPYSHTHVFSPPNRLVKCHLILMALFLLAFSAYVQHRARGLVTARRIRETPTTSIPTGTRARWTKPGPPVEANLRAAEVSYMPVIGGHSPLLRVSCL